MNKTETLKNLLGKSVKFNGYTNEGIKTTIGTVIAVYIEHPCQQNEVKIFCPNLSGSKKYIYKKLNEIKEVTTLKAYAYKFDNTNEIRWFNEELHTINYNMIRVPELDFEKEV